MEPKPSDTFSTRLDVCYEVLLFLASRMQKLEPGEVLEFVSPDPNAPNEVLLWADMRGYEVLAVETLPDQQTRFLIRR